MQGGGKAKPIATPLVAFGIREFRLYWTGLASQIVGQHMFAFTLGWLAFEITHDQAKLGLIHLAAFIPQFLLTMVGGVLADRIDPRRLIQLAQSMLALSVFTIGTLALQGLVEVWHLATAAFALGLSNALDEPSRASFFPRLMPRAMLRAAVPLVSMAFGGSRIIAPSIAGFLIAALGAPSTFLIAALCVSLMVVMMFIVKPTQAPSAPHGSILENLSGGVRYIAANEVFSKVILSALLAATFCMGYFYVLPVYASDILHVDARGLGIISSASGIGSLTGLLSYPWLQSRVSPRNAMVYAMTVYSVSLLGVAFSTWFTLSFVLLMVCGVAQACYMTSFQVILQTLVDDSFRGRVMGVFTQVWSLVYLSGFLLNYAGSLIGPQFALMGGALILLGFVWFSLVKSTALRVLTLAPRPA